MKTSKQKILWQLTLFLGLALSQEALAQKVRMVAAPAKAAAGGGGGGWWQKVDGTLDLATAMTEMRKRGRMGISEECDYNKFIETINKSSENLKMVTDLKRNKAGGKGGLPVFDIVQQALHIGEAVMSAKTAMAEKQGLIEHIEQVCQTGIQQDEVKRQLEMTKMAKQGTEQSVAPMLGSLDLEKARAGAQHKKNVQDWAVNYHDVTDKGALPNDTLWRGADQILLANYQLTQEMNQRLKDLDGMLEVAAVQMYIVADNRGICPNGQPAPLNADTLKMGQGIRRRACAPVLEERATQVMAQMNLLRTEAKALRVAAMARLLQVKTLEVTTGAVSKKRGKANAATGLANGF